MAELKLRTGQVIVPFGIGQIIPNEDGLSLMLGGLNLWDEFIETRRNSGGIVDIEEYEIKDRRLNKLLNVNKLISPFPYINSGERNKYLCLPAVVFPLWHYCSFCGIMEKMSPRDVNRYCTKGACAGKKNKMIPVRFIAACDHGHIEDFPFKEWVHNNDNCANSTLKFKSGGGSGDLAGIWIECLTCGEQKSLSGILTVVRNEQGEITSSALDTFLNRKCQGHKPWTGSSEYDAEGCPGNNHLQVIISGGSNVHYSNITSALILPEINMGREILDLIKPMTMDFLEMIWQQGETQVKIQLEFLKASFEDKISIEELFEKIKKYFIGDEEDGKYSETQVRFQEYEFFKKNNQYSELRTRVQNIERLSMFKFLFRKIVLVEKLKETKVFTGFTRLNSINMMNLEERKRFLTSEEEPKDWLPAYQHSGEGIFFEFDREQLKLFQDYFGRHPRILDYHSAQFQRNPLYHQRDLDGNFILIHTLSHLIIRRLCYRCGYGSSSLKEKIYYSNTLGTEMAGLLIYTASGDAEGSLGGLVSQGKIENFKEIFEEALEEAAWCSADPVCSDLGAEGQGPNNVNGAACHNCAILPETSCEEFNSLLDRGVVKSYLDFTEELSPVH